MPKKLMVGAKWPSSIISSNELLIMILLFPFFKTSGFDFLGGLSPICNAMIAIECTIFFLINLVERRFTTFGKYIVLFSVWTYVIAPLISGNGSPGLFYLFDALGLLSFFDIGFSVHPSKMIKATAHLFAVMITLNALMVLLIPDGFLAEDGARCYLFGIRTGFSLFIIPGILFNLVNDKYKGKTSFYTLLTFLAGGYSLLAKWVVTGLLELLLIVVLLMLMRKKTIATKINLVWVAISLFIVDFSITIMGSSLQIMNAIAILLNKDVTFSGRTLIWAKVIEALSGSPIAGLGAHSTVTIGLTQRSAHNQWLHFAMEGGYVAMIIVVIAVIFSCITLFKSKNSKWYTVVAICTIAVLVGSVTEIQTYVPFFYLIFDMPFLLKRYEENDPFSTTFQDG